jgi:hypothetical protein
MIAALIERIATISQRVVHFDVHCFLDTYFGIVDFDIGGIIARRVGR